MEGQDLVTLFLGGGGLGALWALARWYLKERMQQQLDERTWRQEVQKRRDELRMERLRYEQQAMNEVFTRFGQLSERMSALIFRLALDVAEDGQVPAALAGRNLEEPNGHGNMDSHHDARHLPDTPARQHDRHPAPHRAARGPHPVLPPVDGSNRPAR